MEPFRWIRPRSVQELDSHVSRLTAFITLGAAADQILAKIKDHGMAAILEPAEKGAEIALPRPSRGDAVPAGELFLEDFADDLLQAFEGCGSPRSYSGSK
jgi:hypothetical protein